jgi:acyl-[acyl-carrier-protein]-phospholipid O-acyltransferase / long-chain-fatty-acid--[acyl-carrier-protein] ligase
MVTAFLSRFSSFTYLTITQFLGALNDNIYKLLIVYYLIGIEGFENSHKILAFTGAVFVLPFLLFSAPSGTLADRFSKRDIIVTTKILELVITGFSVLVFAFQSVIGAYAILFLLAVQTALFSPSKYGIIPELVSSEKISKANGLMSSFTFLAIILGTFFASFLLQITGRNYILAAMFCTFISLVGLVTSFLIEITPPAGSVKRFQVFFLKEIFDSLKIASKEPSLLPAVCGSAYFLFLGAFIQLNIIPYAVQSLHLTDVQGGYLFLLTAIGIGTGSIIAGKISGRIVELGLVPFGALGVVISCFALDIFSDHLFAVLPLIVVLGIFGGIYQIPLDSYIQVASPATYRGQIVAATNFLSFFGVLCSSMFIYLIAEVFHLEAAQGFSLMAIITIFTFVAFTFQFFDYLTRFVGMILSKIHFKTVTFGAENIPNCPAVYVCTHTAWNDTLLLLGSQRRRMRFFIENEKEHSKLLKKLYHLLRVVFIPAIEPLENNVACLAEIKTTLQKGISVCIFIDNPNIMAEIEKLKESFYFLKIVETSNYPIIPVLIEKGTKQSKIRSLNRTANRIRVPATISFGSLIHGNQCLLNEPHELFIPDYC